MWRKRLDLDGERRRFVKDVEASRERTMNRAIKLLAAKPRSIEELRERLLEKMWTDEAIVDRVIEKLKEYGYLDDEKYAGELALSRLRQKPQGPRRLKQVLSQKRLSRQHVDTAIANAFENMPEPALIDEAIEKWLRVKGRPENHDQVRKLNQHLMRRGFAHDLIRSKIASIREEDPGAEN